jgi:SAM-dependent methyltransferase
MTMESPHPTRMHDYWLGGGHNTAADRALAERISKAMPGIRDVAQLNQAFLRRAALHMIESGVNQFLDIGSGVPAVGDLRQLVQRVHPHARAVHVDNDPVSVAMTELVSDGVGGVDVIKADVRDVSGILDAAVTRCGLDLGQPVCLIAPMLHFVPDAWDPARLLASYRDRLAPGSGLVLLHVTTDADVPGLAEAIEAYQTTPFRMYPRGRAEVARMCAGFDLVEPGLVGFGEWRPEGPGDVSRNPAINRLLYAAVGRKH